MPEIYQSVVFGMGFWIDQQGLFMSAPSYATGGGCDMDNAIPVYDWENWGELTEHHHSHLAHIVQMCTLNRDSQQLDHYLETFISLYPFSHSSLNKYPQALSAVSS